MSERLRRRRFSRAPTMGALSLMFFFGSASAAETPWRELLPQAERLSAEGKPRRAMQAAQDALAGAEKNLGSENPEVIRILSRLSHFSAEAGDDSRFPEMEKRLSAVKSKDFEVWFALGTLRREEGRSPEAEEALLKALTFKPDDPGAENELANLYDGMGRFQEELPLLKKRAEKSPRDLSPYFQLAQTYFRLGRAAEANETFARVKKIRALAANDYIEEGYFYLSSGHSVQAKEAFESAIAVDTASPFGYHHMGFYLVQSGQYAEAEKYLRLAVEKLEADPNASADDLVHTMNLLGDAIRDQGRSAEAEAVYLKVLEKSRSDGVPLRALLDGLAKLYESLGKSVQAEETYKRALATCRVQYECPVGKIVPVLVDFGQFYLSRGRRTEAEAMAEQAEKACDGAPAGGQRYNALRQVSIFYANLGDAAKREAIYTRLMPMRRAMPFSPELVWVETGMAGLEAARGRFPEAEDHDRRAIATLEHNRSWNEEAGVLDDLAAIDEKDGKAGAGEARERAKSLRGRP